MKCGNVNIFYVENPQKVGVPWHPYFYAGLANLKKMKYLGSKKYQSEATRFFHYVK